MDLSKNAIGLLNNRYLRQQGIKETPEELFKRVARHIALAETRQREKWEEAYYEIMSSLRFLPNSPTLMNAGLPDGQLSACFVLPVQDSLKQIFTTLKNAALIHQSGGGTGFNFSALRPKNDLVSTSGGRSSGPLAFMKVYDAATEYVKQGGRRKGANMGVLNVDHPDIEEFIRSKADGRSLQNFNLSVGITDAFMNALAKGGNWDLINPRTKRVEKRLKAEKIWEAIVKSAWESGDPGLVFLDVINRGNPTPELGTIRATNPCGEVPLLDYESCNLGSLNLSKYLKQERKSPGIDWQQLENDIAVSIRFLDNVITMNHFILPEIEEMAVGNRKMGLGVMGWAELLILLGVPYASDDAVLLGERLMRFIREKSYEVSGSLAEARGCFPFWEQSVFHPQQKMRNATCNSIAPTGSISIIANTSYSIEPLYALAFKRVGILSGETQIEMNAVFRAKMESGGFWNPSLEKEVLRTGSVQASAHLPDALKHLFKTSLEIPWEYHLKHQRAFQQYTDNAVSKTINLPSSADVKEVDTIFRAAWEYGLKGITIYRQGSKVNQVLQKCGLQQDDTC